MMISTKGSALMAVVAFTMVLLVLPGCHKQTPSDTNATKATSDATLPSNDENSKQNEVSSGEGDGISETPENGDNNDGVDIGSDEEEPLQKDDEDYEDDPEEGFSEEV